MGSKNEEVVELAQKLVQINSENPPGREKEIAAFIADFLKETGLRPQKKEYVKGRPNILCRLNSQSRKKTILISPHLDTVPAGNHWQHDPFGGKIVKGRLYGRGASDCKSNLAVSLQVLKELKAKGGMKNIDVLWVATADEESGSKAGFLPLVKELPALDYALILDGCDFEIIFGQKGVLHIELEFQGKKAHAAYPEKGANAIHKAALFIRKMQELIKLLPPAQPSSLTFNCGWIQGGEKVNMVAESCLVQVDLRLPFGWTKARALQLVKKAIRLSRAAVHFKILAYQEPALTSKDTVLIRILKSSLVKNYLRPRLKTIRGATVMSFLLRRQIPTAIFGFATCGQEHTKDEYVRVANLIKGTNVLKDFLELLDIATDGR